MYFCTDFYLLTMQPINVSTHQCINISTYLLLLALLVTSSCGLSRGGQVAVSDTEALPFEKDQVWQLVALRGKTVPQTAQAVTLVLYPEGGTLHGLIACNRYAADYTASLLSVTSEGTRYRLAVRSLKGDGVQCPEADMAMQERFLALLARADACLLTPYTLTLFQNNKEILKFELQ